LLIDVKTVADNLCRADKVLADYADLLTTTKAADRAEGVTAVPSGNRPSMRWPGSRAARGHDGRLENLQSNEPVMLPWISANWTLLFTWKGAGPMPTAEKQKLTELVSRAHDQGRQVRFWATPEKEAVWAELTAAGVDYINTDKLAELQKFLSGR
jgi:hypothetical protein